MATVVDRPRGAGATPAPRAVHATWWRSRQLKGIGYATPAALVVAVFFVTPLVLVGWMSLNHWPLIGSPSPNVPDNYTGLYHNPLIPDAIWFTLKYTAVVTVVLILAALGLALLVQERRLGVGLFRTAYFLPGAVGLASASLLFYGMLRGDGGPVDGILRHLGLIDHPVSWTGTPTMALASTVGLIVWRFAGFDMLILLTGLQAIPTELYEAARVDGAGHWRVFRRITLPLLRPTLALILVLTITGSLLAFDQFFIFTRGGPDNSTLTVVMVVYREAFVRFDLGAAAALSVVVLAVLVLLNVLQLRVLRRGSSR
jgi:multiple sugar transport system permease protein